MIKEAPLRLLIPFYDHLTMSLITFSATLLIGSFLWAVINRILKDQSHSPLPPGPPADPIIGHLRIMPTKDSHEFFYEMGQKYGT